MADTSRTLHSPCSIVANCYLLSVNAVSTITRTSWIRYFQWLWRIFQVYLRLSKRTYGGIMRSCFQRRWSNLGFCIVAYCFFFRGVLQSFVFWVDLLRLSATSVMITLRLMCRLLACSKKGIFPHPPHKSHLFPLHPSLYPHITRNHVL